MDTGEVGCPDGRVGLARVALAVLFAWQARVDGGGSGGVVHSQRLDLAEEDAWLESASVPANMAGRADQCGGCGQKEALTLTQQQQIAWAQTVYRRWHDRHPSHNILKTPL